LPSLEKEKMMDEKTFIAFMEKANKPIRTINSYIKSVNFYTDFLQSQLEIKTPYEAKPIDIKEFVKWGTERGENVYRHLWGIRMYYQFEQLVIMENTASELMEYIQNETRKLGEFPKVDQGSVRKLSKIGISTVNQLLKAGNNREKLTAISKLTGVSQVALVELSKLSNLSRLPGLKKVRCRLFYEAGLDTLASISALEPIEVQKILQEYVERTGFEGSAPTLSEAEVAVRMARFLPENVT
jgi:Domain of unknown function (DUF4332)